MPVIAVINPKGGAGKSTTCLVIGTVMASRGATVSIIDTDPQRTLAKWAAAGLSEYAPLVKAETDANALLDMIDDEASKKQFVLVDVQGRASLTMARVISRATFVIIATQAKTADAEEAVEAIKLLRSEEKALRRTINHRVLFVRTSAGIPTLEEKELTASMNAANVPVLQTKLSERTAFSRLFADKKSLQELDPLKVNGLPAANSNAAALAAEVLQICLGDHS